MYTCPKVTSKELHTHQWRCSNFIILWITIYYQFFRCADKILMSTLLEMHKNSHKTKKRSSPNLYNTKQAYSVLVTRMRHLYTFIDQKKVHMECHGHLWIPKTGIFSKLINLINLYSRYGLSPYITTVPSTTLLLCATELIVLKTKYFH